MPSSSVRRPVTRVNAVSSMLPLRTATPGGMVCSPDVHVNPADGSREGYSTQPRFLGGSAGERMRAGGPRSRIGLGAAALDRVAFGAPAQHPAGQVGDILEAGLLQDVRRLGRAAAGPAYRDDRPVAREFAGALRQVPKRDQDRVPDVAKRPGEFLGLAHI